MERRRQRERGADEVTAHCWGRQAGAAHSAVGNNARDGALRATAGEGGGVEGQGARFLSGEKEEKRCRSSRKDAQWKHRHN